MQRSTSVTPQRYNHYDIYASALLNPIMYDPVCTVQLYQVLCLHLKNLNSEGLTSPTGTERLVTYKILTVYRNAQWNRFQTAMCKYITSKLLPCNQLDSLIRDHLWVLMVCAWYLLPTGYGKSAVPHIHATHTTATSPQKMDLHYQISLIGLT